MQRSELLDASPSNSVMVSQAERVEQMLDRYPSVKLRTACDGDSTDVRLGS